MTLGIWEPLIEEDSRALMKSNVHHAINMGAERYANVVGNLAGEVVFSSSMDALASSLIVGAIAFDAQAAFEIEFGEGFTLKIQLEQK